MNYSRALCSSNITSVDGLTIIFCEFSWQFLQQVPTSVKLVRSWSENRNVSCLEFNRVFNLLRNNLSNLVFDFFKRVSQSYHILPTTIRLPCGISDFVAGEYGSLLRESGYFGLFNRYVSIFCVDDSKIHTISRSCISLSRCVQCSCKLLFFITRHVVLKPSSRTPYM